jgi:hypothetical protein
MIWKLLDAIGQALQTAGLLLALPGLWLERLGRKIEGHAFKKECVLACRELVDIEENRR